MFGAEGIIVVGGGENIVGGGGHPKGAGRNQIPVVMREGLFQAADAEDLGEDWVWEEEDLKARVNSGSWR